MTLEEFSFCIRRSFTPSGPGGPTPEAAPQSPPRGHAPWFFSPCASLRGRYALIAARAREEDNINYEPDC